MLRNFVPGQVYTQNENGEFVPIGSGGSVNNNGDNDPDCCCLAMWLWCLVILAIVGLIGWAIFRLIYHV